LFAKKGKAFRPRDVDGETWCALTRTPTQLRAKVAGRIPGPDDSLNPVLTIGTQLIETLQEHLELDSHSAKGVARNCWRRLVFRPDKD